MTDESVSQVVKVITELHGNANYHFPLAAAFQQFRTHYYQMTASELLEDVYADTLQHYIKKHDSNTSFKRANRGEKEWDYEIGDTKVSHKTIKEVEDVAVFWDPTRVLEEWTAEYPIVLVLTGTKNMRADLNGKKAPLRPVRDPKSQSISKGKIIQKANDSVVKAGKSLLLVNWPHGNQELEVLKKWECDEDTNLSELLPFGDIWKKINEHFQNGGSANDVELVQVTTSNLKKMSEEQTLIPLSEFDDNKPLVRSGVYVINPSDLQGVKLKMGNRGNLIPAKRLQKSLVETAAAGNFTPLPTWFGLFMQDRPPNLYLPQLADFESQFSESRSSEGD